MAERRESVRGAATRRRGRGRTRGGGAADSPAAETYHNGMRVTTREGEGGFFATYESPISRATFSVPRGYATPKEAAARAAHEIDVIAAVGDEEGAMWALREGEGLRQDFPVVTEAASYHGVYVVQLGEGQPVHTVTALDGDGGYDCTCAGGAGADCGHAAAVAEHLARTPARTACGFCAAGRGEKDTAWGDD